MNGSASARPMSPSDRGSRVRAYTCHETTTACSWVATFIVSRLTMNQRKLAIRSEA